MSIEFEQHDDICVVWPALYVTEGECTNPDCKAKHYCITLGWLVWDVHFSW